MKHALLQHLHRRGMTLAEMLLALTILAIVSTAVLSMIQLAGRVNGAVSNSITNDLEIESAICRILANGRTCSSMTVPSGTSDGATFSMQTQPDAANGNASYDITYTFANGQLTETQYIHGTTTPRFGTASAVLIRDLQAFSVRLKAAGSPQVAILTLTAGSGPSATRTFRVTPRNQ
jgi:prepilin-type N-terminal cleavage/methylation domain-containing protein